LIDNHVETLEELMRQISLSDIVVASRFHGVLLAHVLLKPTIAVSYHDKIDTLMEDMGHSSLCCDICSFTPEMLVQKFQIVERDAELLRTQIKAKEVCYREALAKQYDRIFSTLKA
jgi:polysaccharide pyruvyl transferase WcaK-like protein